MKLLQKLFLGLLLAGGASAHAATTTLEVCTADTGGTPNDTVAFTPASNDLLVVFVRGSGTVGNPGTLTNSAGLTFTQFLFRTDGGGFNSDFAFVADALVSSATSQTVTFDNSDPGTGTVICVYAVAGVTRVGLDALKQSDFDAIGNGTVPEVVFDAAALTGNPVLVFAGNTSNPAGITPPTNWTEPASGDVGYDSPSVGGAVAHRDSGFTGTTITWGATSTLGTAFAAEIDTSAEETTPTFDTACSITAETTDTMTCSYNTADAQNMYLAMVAKDSAACTCSDIIANTCAGEIAYATEAATNNADTLDITYPGGDPMPLVDIKACARNVTLMTSVTDLNDEAFDVPAGRQYITKSGGPGAGEVGIVDGASPAAADSDTIDAPLLSDSFLQGDGAHCVTVAANTTFSINVIKDNDCTTDVTLDESRQLLCRRFADYSVGAWSDAPCVDLAINNGAPIYFGLDDIGGTIDPYLFETGEAISVPVTSIAVDPEMDDMTLAVDALAGMSVTGGDTWAGTPEDCGVNAGTNFAATDEYGDSDNEDETVTFGAMIPDVTDETLAAAIVLIEGEKAVEGCLLTVVEGTPVFSDTIAAGNVVSTDPAIGTVVPPDQEVTVFLSLGPSVGGKQKKMRARNGMRLIFE